MAIVKPFSMTTQFSVWFAGVKQVPGSVCAPEPFLVVPRCLKPDEREGRKWFCVNKAEHNSGKCGIGRRVCKSPPVALESDGAYRCTQQGRWSAIQCAYCPGAVVLFGAQHNAGQRIVLPWDSSLMPAIWVSRWMWHHPNNVLLLYGRLTLWLDVLWILIGEFLKI